MEETLNLEIPLGSKAQIVARAIAQLAERKFVLEVQRGANGDQEDDIIGDAVQLPDGTQHFPTYAERSAELQAGIDQLMSEHHDLMPMVRELLNPPEQVGGGE